MSAYKVIRRHVFAKQSILANDVSCIPTSAFRVIHSAQALDWWKLVNSAYLWSDG